MSSKIKKFIKSLGPGFITGAGDDDPSGIATYSQAGAAFGYNLLWTSLFSIPFMTAVQEMCGRIGMVTGKGLAGVIRLNYSKKILYFSVLVLVIANTVNIGTDLGAMAASANLLFGLPFTLWLLLITGLTLVLEVFVSYRVYARYLKFLALSLFAYIAVVFVVKQDWASILVSTVLPSITYSKEYLMVIVAIFGTTISPYLFFWQADEEVEEEVAAHKLRTMGKGVPRITRGDIRKMRLDTLIGMVFSCIVMFFIIATTASTLHVHGITSIETANQAAEALKPFAGEFTHLLFAAGIIGTGLLAVPILAGSASYALSETFGWKEGLYRRFTQAHGFYGVITIATIVGLIINFTPIPPFKMLFYTAILNGVCAPPLLVLIMLISNNRKIMGENVNKTASNIFGWAIAGVMSLTALALAISLF